jgi:hypothetical protein
MTQSKFSALASDYILAYHPDFGATFQYKDDGSFDCSIKSKKRHLTIWIATYDNEITIGFEDVNAKCDWHTHMRLFDAHGYEEEFLAMTKLLKAILSDEEPILFSSKNGYTLTDNIEEDFASKDRDEVLTVYKWSEL